MESLKQPGRNPYKNEKNMYTPYRKTPVSGQVQAQNGEKIILKLVKTSHGRWMCRRRISLQLQGGCLFGRTQWVGQLFEIKFIGLQGHFKNAMDRSVCVCVCGCAQITATACNKTIAMYELPV